MTSFSDSPAAWFKGRFSHPNAVLDPLSAAIEPSNDMIVLPFHHAYRNKLRNDPCAHSRRFHARLAVALRP